MNSIYELIDVTDDDTWYTLGWWPSLEASLAALAEQKQPQDIAGSPNQDEDYCRLQIHKRPSGWGCWSDSKAVYSIEFTQRYDEDRDEYVWDRRDWN